MCPHGTGLSHLVADLLMGLPFLTEIVFYIKAKFTIPWKWRNGDLFLAEPLKNCHQDQHNFQKVVTKNGIRLDGDSPCQCQKYPNLVKYSQDVDQNI